MKPSHGRHVISFYDHVELLLKLQRDGFEKLTVKELFQTVIIEYLRDNKILKLFICQTFRPERNILKEDKYQIKKERELEEKIEKFFSFNEEEVEDIYDIISREFKEDTSLFNKD